MENVFKRVENMKTERNSWKVEGGWRHHEINEKSSKEFCKQALGNGSIVNAIKCAVNA